MPRQVIPPYLWDKDFARLAKAFRIEWSQEDLLAAERCREAGFTPVAAAVALAGYAGEAAACEGFIDAGNADGVHSATATVDAAH